MIPTQAYPETYLAIGDETGRRGYTEKHGRKKTKMEKILMETLFVLPIAIFLVILTLSFAVVAVAINERKNSLGELGQNSEAVHNEMKTR